jgi:hypothetical protein
MFIAVLEFRPRVPLSPGQASALFAQTAPRILNLLEQPVANVVRPQSSVASPTVARTGLCCQPRNGPFDQSQEAGV